MGAVRRAETSARQTGTYPHFLGIGAQKAGTTWLYRNLASHPRIWLPPEKELHYFDETIDAWRSLGTKLFGMAEPERRWRRQFRCLVRGWRELRTIDDVRWRARYFFARPSDEWYASLFRPGDGSVTGEISPGYALLTRERVAHVHRLMPDARIIYLIRNPVERPWSYALMQAGRFSARWRLRPDAVRRHFRSEASRVRTDYVRTIDTWRSMYDADQVFIAFVEDIHFRPEELLARICAFIGVDEPSSWPHVRQRVFATSTTETIPTDLAAELATLHGALIEELDRRFAGYASWWRHAAERLRNGPGVDGDEILYPLYRSHLWLEWNAALGRGGDDPPPLQSGPLSTIAPSRDETPD